jgi:hypothetical protein
MSPGVHDSVYRALGHLHGLPRLEWDLLIPYGDPRLAADQRSSALHGAGAAGDLDACPVSRCFP